MNKHIFSLAALSLLLLSITAIASKHYTEAYNPVWTAQSANSSESMPCGGGDIGLNVWVENGDLLFYIQRSGTFDENNTFPKLGRIRVKLSPNPFEGEFFRQELMLHQGYVQIEGRNGRNSATVEVWVDVFRPFIQVEINGNFASQAVVTYENWRYEDRALRKSESFGNAYKWAPPTGLQQKKDEIAFSGDRVLFYHRNQGPTVFDATVKQQKMEAVKDQLYNPLENLTFGGILFGKNMVKGRIVESINLDTPFRGWQLQSVKPARTHQVSLVLHTDNCESAGVWQSSLEASIAEFEQNAKTARIATQNWWNDFWERSFIKINHQKADTACEAWQIGRNYQLFRYLLGCNAFGDWPTKFNGGLFTYDPVFTNENRAFTPDFRNWGGGTFTAQNQRLVYFPLFKSGDFDMVKPQIDFYVRLLKNAELRSQHYWGHGGASFTEQIENFGLPNPSEYGWKRPENYDAGIEYNAWLEYQWDTALEICEMALLLNRYTGKDISEYLPLIESCLTFFDEHYQYLASKRGIRVLDSNGHLVLYPGSACETYKMATNAVSTLVALQEVSKGLLTLNEISSDSVRRTRWEGFLKRIPPISYRVLEDKKMIAPARMWERVNNTEVPQLYPVFPWRLFGVGKPDLDVARNTYLNDPDALKFRGHASWKQDVIWAACLGLTDEAVRLLKLKLGDSGRRFPAFWGPGFDWVPDHNWGGSGMIGLQEMLLQTNGDRILLFPAWPKNWDVHFRLHVSKNTMVEAGVNNGKAVIYKVTPSERAADTEVMLKD